MTCYLLEVTLSGCIREFFFIINLFSLINGKAVVASYITIDLTFKLNYKETVNKSCF